MWSTINKLWQNWQTCVWAWPPDSATHITGTTAQWKVCLIYPLFPPQPETVLSLNDKYGRKSKHRRSAWLPNKAAQCQVFPLHLGVDIIQSGLLGSCRLQWTVCSDNMSVGWSCCDTGVGYFRYECVWPFTLRLLEGLLWRCGMCMCRGRVSKCSERRKKQSGCEFELPSAADLSCPHFHCVCFYVFLFVCSRFFFPRTWPWSHPFF